MRSELQSSKIKKENYHQPDSLEEMGENFIKQTEEEFTWEQCVGGGHLVKGLVVLFLLLLLRASPCDSTVSC